jgi:hypothetical protein
MRIDSIIANLRALIRANSIIADIHARNLVTRSGIAGVAGLVAAFGLVMFGLAAFFALEPVWGRVWAAVAVGAASCAIALMLVLIAGRIAPGHDLELAREVHKSALEGLIADARAVEAEATKLRNAVTHPLDSLIPAVVVPIAGILLNILKKRTRSNDPAP